MLSCRLGTTRRPDFEIKAKCFFPQATSQQPEAMFSLSAKVKEQFEQRIAGLSDAELRSHSKVVAFRENVKSVSNEGNVFSCKRCREKV